MAALYICLLSVAGFSISFPFSVKREPWQGQSHECSTRLYFKAQPRCGQRGTVGVNKPIIVSNAFMANWGCIILLDGEKSVV